ncbi:hypothetical protein Sp245p_23880 (plasmid) [Azospirillum baldaniorum]|uniref:Uncharacterized protein n=1 Tax=Azospirillum baldaniorum TaxID=1064539 RepID=A0A9P1NR67_9PROT|nr:hypothetical protein Sp245p_23880 [Azospirillum baldaniorum]CCD02560.1 protein of unknown function [Azospirillum baldaniorum]
MTTCFTWPVVVIDAARLPVIPSSAGGVAYSDCGGGGHKGGGLVQRPAVVSPRIAPSEARPAFPVPLPRRTMAWPDNGMDEPAAAAIWLAGATERFTQRNTTAQTAARQVEGTERSTKHSEIPRIHFQARRPKHLRSTGADQATGATASEDS